MFPRAKLDSLELEADGAQLFRAVLPPREVEAVLSVVEAHDSGRPGSRLPDIGALLPWLGANGVVGQIVAQRLGPSVALVRAILFDKNAGSNWALSWHQDRTIAVSKRADVQDFTNWNRKSGVDHVEPPFDLIERMITVRIHLDPVSPGNAPLIVSPGTHRLGRIAEKRIADIVEHYGSIDCLAETGDVWIYRTAILHASRRATTPGRRRVLQVDYSAERLPDPLRWFLVP